MIRLAAFDRADIEGLVGWVGSEEELFAWAGNTFTHPLDAGQLERHLERESAHNLIFKALSEDGAHVGHIELYLGERERRSGTLCRLFVPPERRRSGIGSAIMAAAIEHAFGELGLRSVDLRAFADSEHVLRFHESLGFVRGPVHPDGRQFRGESRSLVVMSLQQSVWRKRRAEPVPW